MVHFPLLRVIAESIGHIAVGALESGLHVPLGTEPMNEPEAIATTLGNVLGESVRRIAGETPTLKLLEILGHAIDHAGQYLRTQPPFVLGGSVAPSMPPPSKMSDSPQASSATSSPIV